MKKIKSINDIDFSSVDFMDNADNIYRTKDYIVKQKIKTSFCEDTMITRLVSNDTYYLRTNKRDAEYEVIFKERGKEINGKRIRTAMFVRKYID